MRDLRYYQKKHSDVCNRLHVLTRFALILVRKLILAGQLVLFLKHYAFIFSPPFPVIIMTSTNVSYKYLRSELYCISFITI